jgi:hypothetical protein
MYTQWLYTRQMPKLDCEDTFNMLAKLYVLGEYAQDIVFQNAVFDAMLWASDSIYPSLESLRTIYNGTPPTSTMRKLLIDMTAYQITPASSRIEDLNPEKDSTIILDLLNAVLKSRPPPGTFEPLPWLTDSKRYRPVAPRSNGY